MEPRIRAALVPILLLGLLPASCDSSRSEKAKVLRRVLAAQLGELDRRFRSGGSGPGLADELRRLEARLPADMETLRKQVQSLRSRVDAAVRTSEERPQQERLARLEERLLAEGASEALLAEIETFTGSISDDMFRLRARSEKLTEQVKRELRETGLRTLRDRGRALEDRLLANGASSDLLAAARAYLADLVRSPLDVAGLRDEHGSLTQRIEKGLRDKASRSYRAWLEDLKAREEFGASELLLREAKRLQDRIPIEYPELARDAAALTERIERAYEKVKALARLEEQLGHLESDLETSGASEQLEARAREYRSELEQSPWKSRAVVARTAALLTRIRTGVEAARVAQEAPPPEDTKDETLEKLLGLRKELGKLEAGIPADLTGIRHKYRTLLASLDAEIRKREGGGLAEAAARAELPRIPKGWSLPEGVLRKGEFFVMDGPDPSEMLLISPGRFSSGDRKELAPFLMDRFEVTVERFRPFVEEMRRRPSRFTGDLLYWDEVGYDYPTQAVVGISLHDVRSFARWAGKQVPTEAQWEYAASWDADKNLWRRYPWGDRFGPEIQRKAFPPLVTELGLDTSPWGVRRMGTGVKEWCEHAEFRIESGVIRGASQVLGSRTDRIRASIADARIESSWKTRAKNLGFRCILELKKAK